MPLSTRFFSAISSVISREPSQGFLDKLSRVNPDRFYVENVRALLGVPHRIALALCETAVRQGLFLKKVEVRSPEGLVVASANRPDDLPPMVTYMREDSDGHYVEEETPRDRLSVTPFYALAGGRDDH